MQKTKTLFFPLFYLLLLVSCHQKNEAEAIRLIQENPIIANDISNQKISVIAEDAQGHIWLGTFRGLNKYNVHEYHQYFCADDSLDLPDNQIKDIFLDSKNRFWVSTVNGICQYTDKDNFVRIPIDIFNKNGTQILENKQGKIFLNMVTQLCVYNPQKNKFECAIENLDPQRTFNGKCYIDNNNNLWVVNPLALRCYDSSTMQLKDSIPVTQYSYYSYMSENGRIWLSSKNTLSIYDTYDRKFVDTPDVIQKHPILSQSTIEYIYPYENNSLLLNTTQNGLFLYNYIDNTVIHQDESGFPFEVPHFKISCMFTDSQKNLWIGSVDQSYVVRYNYKKRFNNNNHLRSCVEKKSVVAVTTDKENHLWIATLMDGLYMYDLNKMKVKIIDIQAKIPQEKDKINISQLFVDESGAIWMAAPPYKVIKCRYQNEDLQVEAVYPIFAPMTITQDSNKTIWVGSACEYVFALPQGENQFKPIKIFPTSFTFIPGLLPLKNGTILIAAFIHKMQYIKTDTWNVQEVKIPDEDVKACIQRSVFIPTVLYEDSQGDVWIGTVSNGLMRYSPSTNRMQPVHGIPCTDISAIEEDIQGNIWISTLYGLSKYDRVMEKFTNYYTTDGIGGNQFYDRSSCSLPDGTLVFGGTHGLTFFNPIDVTFKRNIPLLFEDLKIHNKLVRPQESFCINKHLSYKPKIHLKHSQNSFSISYAALDYCEYERVHYYYKLEGFDKFWIDANNNREAYYANLPAGKYTFKVKITNNDKSIVEAENSIQVIVSPTPWLSWWAYCIYWTIGAILVFLFFRIRFRIKKEKENTLRIKQEKEQERRVNKMNMSFFANISHELRTPLTMISGPVKLLCDAPDVEEEHKKLLHIVQRSVNRMLKLINQLMDFNRLENDTLQLAVKRTDIISVLRQLTDTFSASASNKKIALNTHGLEDSFILWLDEDKVDKIISNLLSNAMKFTAPNGKIDLFFDVITREEAIQLFALTDKDKDTQYIKIVVADNGKGVPEDQLEKIFERYYQVDEQQATGTYNWGTGIGLYYARSLAELHHGYLKANNREEGCGSLFTLILPVNDFSYSLEEQQQSQATQTEAFPLQNNGQDSIAEQKENTKEQKTILVVEDDTEITYYLKVLLSPYYKVICRFDAESAFKTITEEAPDLILSDVVMPGKNGYQLCRQIKEDLQMCHIPVILVTAKVTVESQVEGLNTGADAYVTKPFEPTYLLALIKSLLKNREKVRNLLSKTTQASRIVENILSPQDKAFMTDLYQLMEDELSNSELDISHMTEWLKISRTKFYYKVKGLTGENPSVFFKTYKLNRAAELLTEGKYNVSEIADMTGFATLSHFSTSFKKKFGVTPSEYK